MVSLKGKTNEKGQALSDFIEYLFKETKGFSIVRKGFLTPTEEIDFIIEFIELDPFWNQFGALIFVECKNTQIPIPAKQIRGFAGKIDKKERYRLGIFITSSRFTGKRRQGALGEIRDINLNKNINITARAR
jgi:hypothetical protein